MRIACAVLLCAAVASAPVHARRDVVKFAGVQERCVQAGDIEFGANARWPSCQVTKGRWFATMGIIDLYQAQYCLGKDDGICEERALLVFANRAYTPEARVLLQRRDSGATEYDDPVVVETAYGDILTITGRVPDGAETKTYYVWRKDRWMPIDARAWLRDLAKHLPKGDSVASRAWPDIDTMSVRAPLERAGEASGEFAEIELALKNDRFVVKKVRLAHKD